MVQSLTVRWSVALMRCDDQALRSQPKRLVQRRSSRVWSQIFSRSLAAVPPHQGEGVGVPYRAAIGNRGAKPVLAVFGIFLYGVLMVLQVTNQVYRLQSACSPSKLEFTLMTQKIRMTQLVSQLQTAIKPLNIEVRHKNTNVTPLPNFLYIKRITIILYTFIYYYILTIFFLYI